jgi:hypothetical protein
METITAAGRAVLAAVKFGKTVIPRWMLPIFAACLIIPGPLDEAALAVAVVAIIAVSGPKRRAFAGAVREAWRGNLTARVCPDCGAPAGQPCTIACIADQAWP